MIASIILLLASTAWFDANVGGSAKWPAGTEAVETAGVGKWDGRLFVAETGTTVSYDESFGNGFNFKPAVVRDAAEGDVTIASKMTFTARKRLAMPDGAKAALTVLGEGEDVVYYGIVAGDWVALDGATPELDAAKDVAITLKTVEDALYVRYAVDGTALTSGGEEWLASAADATDVSRVSYIGTGSVSSLAGEAVVPTCTLTIPETLEGMSVAKVSVGGIEINPTAERVYDIPTNAFVTVAFTPAKGYILDSRTMLFEMTGSMELPEEGRPTLISPMVITINEILASPDEIYERDWVELRNAANVDVNVEGWFMSDNYTKKKPKFQPIEGPAIVPANGYLVIQVDDETAEWPADVAHVALGLSDSGESLALATAADAKSIISSVVFDIQFDDITCGYAEADGEVGTALVYFREPTPGAANETTAYAAPTRQVTLSEPHGWKNAPFELTMATVDGKPGDIRYTLDGSAPTLESPLYEGPISISTTTVVRAGIPVAGESILQRDVSGSYLFVNDIVNQGTTPPPGFPAHKAVNDQEMYYGMSKLVTEGADRDRVFNGFTNAIPSVSVVIDPKFLFDKDVGIYVNAKKESQAWERMALFEQIDPVNGTANEWTGPAGLRIRGGASRKSLFPKHSFRLFFRRNYGMNKLKFKLFGDEGASSFKRIDLRTSQNFSWANGGPNDNFIYECVSRDTQGAFKTDLYTRTRACHLFINGIYWGLYQTDERIDDHYAETYNGGDKSEYDVVRTSHNENLSFETGIVEGNDLAWKALWNLMNAGFDAGNYPKACGLNADYTRNPNYPILLNAPNLMRYMISTHWRADTDTPSYGNGPNNVAALRNRIDGSGAQDGFMFIQHDNEYSLGFGKAGYKDDTTSYGTTDMASNNGSWSYFAPAQLHFRLCKNAEYKMAFADQVYRLTVKKGGVLTAPEMLKRFRARMAEVDDAIACEAARWGWRCPDNKKPTHELWLTNCLTSINFIEKRFDYFMVPYKGYRKWYPSVGAPTLSRAGDELVDGDVVMTDVPLSLAVSDGATVYYTLDGTDPRLVGGGVNPAASVYDAAKGLVFRKSGQVRVNARAIDAKNAWSPLESVQLTVRAGTVLFLR